MSLNVFKFHPVTGKTSGKPSVKSMSQEYEPCKEIYDSPQSREMPWVLAALYYLENIE